MNGELKEAVFQFAQKYVDDKMNGIQSRIDEVVEALGSETKSSAGDKHETGRAMLQLEREKLGQQLFEIEKMKRVLSRLPKKNEAQVVALGSLVKTSKGSFYISISAGKFVNAKEDIYCISPSTPIGQLLLGKSVGESISFNGQVQEIISID